MESCHQKHHQDPLEIINFRVRPHKVREKPEFAERKIFLSRLIKTSRQT